MQVTQEESHSGGTEVEFYTTVTLLSTLQYCDSCCLDSTVTVMAATLAGFILETNYPSQTNYSSETGISSGYKSGVRTGP